MHASKNKKSSSVYLNNLPKWLNNICLIIYAKKLLFHAFHAEIEIKYIDFQWVQNKIEKIYNGLKN